MKKYTVGGWVLSFPDQWCIERDQVDGHWLFYPPDSPLTVHVTPFQFAKDGVPPPAEVVRELFRVSLGRNGVGTAAPKPWPWPLPQGFSGEVFSSTAQEGGRELCRLSLGFYGPGELLSVNIYGETEAESRQAMDHFKTLERG